MTPADQTPATPAGASNEPAYTLVYWGGAGLPDNHQNDCYLRRGARYRFSFIDGKFQDARFRSFDGTTLVIVVEGTPESRPIATLEQIYTAPGNDAWGVAHGPLGEGPNG